VRPVVLRDDVEILIRVGDEKSSFFVSMDSRIREVQNPLDLVIRKAGFRINLLRLKDALFFDTLRDKLNWGLDVRN
jgi:NAD+ kinase